MDECGYTQTICQNTAALQGCLCGGSASCSVSTTTPARLMGRGAPSGRWFGCARMSALQRRRLRLCEYELRSMEDVIRDSREMLGGLGGDILAIFRLVYLISSTLTWLPFLTTLHSHGIQGRNIWYDYASSSALSSSHILYQTWIADR